MRWKAALWLAWLYAVCILLPPAAFALSTAHCLTDMNAAHMHQAAADASSNTHVHPDGVVHAHGEQGSHQHADGSAPHQHDADEKTHGNCCGLFCVTAMAHAAPALLAAPAAAGQAVPALEEALSGRGPDRINRPPIA